MRELVVVAGELHAEDLEDGHITVLSQMLAAAATNPDLRGPIRERFEPWIEIVERALVRVLDGTPYAGVLPVHDLALAVTRRVHRDRIAAQPVVRRPVRPRRPPCVQDLRVAGGRPRIATGHGA